MSVETEDKMTSQIMSDPEIIKPQTEMKFKKTPMNLTAKEFIPKSSLKDESCNNTEETNKSADETKNIAKLTSNSSTSRPKSLPMTTSNNSANIIPETNIPSNLYQSIPPTTQQVYPMDYNCITNVDQSSFITTNITTPSPVIIHQSSLFQPFHNSGGSSPHSYQSVSPPILNNTAAFPAAATVPPSATVTNGTNPSNMTGEHYVMVHVNLGETFSIRVGDQIQNISGPATVRMVSNSGPPTPMPMQVPPGHMVQQIVDENGILTHVILSPLHQPPPVPPPQTAPCIGSHMNTVPHQSSTFYNPAVTGTSHISNSTISPAQNSIFSNMTQVYPNNHVGPISTITTTSTTNNGLHSDESNKTGTTTTQHNNNTSPINNNSTTNTTASSTITTAVNLNDSINEQTHITINQKPLRHQHKSSHSQASTTITNTSENSRNRDDNYYEQFPMYNSHQYKYRKRRQFPGKYNHSASANTKHHYIQDQRGSPISSADEVGTILTDEEKNAIRDVLNTIEKPEVSEIEARSALIHIICPKVPDNCAATINTADFTFQLHFTERQPDGRYNCVFYGEAVEISLQDLKPATDYFVKVCCIYENISGNLSSYNKFTTLCAEPNAPKPVILQSKNRNSIHVKWSSPVENGAKITEYILEYSRADSNTENFIQAYRGNSKTYKIQKLKPSTEYLIRLAAVNSFGQSGWSESISITTSGTAPPAPEAPILARADTNGLLLTWKKRASTSNNSTTSTSSTNPALPASATQSEETFCLDMMDEATGYGFITVFNGPEVEHYVENLRRNTQYRFRLSASNQDGRSKWSDVVTMTTKPDLPGPPHRLHIRGGRAQATQFVMVWDPPEDDGGLPVVKYRLELDATSGSCGSEDGGTGGDWETVYEGEAREFTCRNQLPGSTVLARVSAYSAGGFWGAPSNTVTIQLASHAPGVMLPPRKDTGANRKGTNSTSPSIFQPGTINLVWEPPENNGGTAVTGYELCQWSLKIKRRLNSKDAASGNIEHADEIIDESEEQIAYSGNQLSCQIVDLIPGAQYRYRIRAINKAGSGKWSTPMDAISGPSAPESPHEGPTVTCKSSYCVSVTWNTPVTTNGSKITDYKVEYKMISSSSSHNDSVSNSSNTISSDFQLVYSGSQLSCEVRNLQPNTSYAFRYQVGNRAGYSKFSPITEVTTPAAAPGLVSALKITAATLNTVTLSWREPITNGSPLSSYVIEGACCHCQSTSATATATSSHNTTQNVDNNSCHSNTDLMFQDVFTLITEGTEKVISELLPDTSYKFRVKAVNGVGSGSYCNPIKTSTLSPPPAPPQLESVSVQSNAIKLKWHNSMSPRQYYITKLLAHTTTNNTANTAHMSHPGCSGSEPTISQYQLQMSRQPDSGWSSVYTGSLQFHKHSKLLESTNYYFRIMAINDMGNGDYSEPLMVCTEKAAPPSVRAPKIINVTSDSCIVEWPALRPMNNDPIVYILQLLSISEKDSDYKQIWKENGKEMYRGSETCFSLTDLSPATEYMTRVCAVRLCSPSTINGSNPSSPTDPNPPVSLFSPGTNSSPVTELHGAFSKSVHFATLGRGVTTQKGAYTSGLTSNYTINTQSHHTSCRSTSSYSQHLVTSPDYCTNHHSNTSTSSSSFSLVQSAPIKFIQSHLLDRIGPWTDKHFIVLILILFTIFVLVLANLLQVYLK